jgi:hypothetical protein
MQIVDEQLKLRAQTNMILHATELAVAKFITDNAELKDLTTSSILKKIKERPGVQAALSARSIDAVVQECYLDELVGLAIDVAKGTEKHDLLVRLRECLSELHIFEIRQSAAHPVRPFYMHYWYRAAALGTDPIFDLLGMTDVKSAALAAISENLSEISEEWLLKAIHVIPNNLPALIDHEITGLIGRTEEMKELRKRIQSQKFPLIAIVAPGGIGKTSLALECMRTISKDENLKDTSRFIIFVSAKTHELSDAGIQRIAPDKTFNELYQEIVEAIVDVLDLPIQDGAAEIDTTAIPGILVVDNLETVIREHEQEFQDFYEQLPEQWKVVITSRIPIDGASTIKLDPLSMQASEQLGNIYSRRRGFELSNEVVAKLVNACYHNPLAIRLTIDGVGVGGSVPQVIQQIRQDVLQYSYDNLVRGLPEESWYILEALFLGSSHDRSELADLTGLDPDPLAKGISALARTSLIRIVATEQGLQDEISLTEGIRDLLLISDLTLKVRDAVQSRSRKARDQVIQNELRQKQLGIDEYNWFYISSDLPPALVALLDDTRTVLLKKSYSRIEIGKRRAEFDGRIDEFRDYASFWLYCAELSDILKDWQKTEEYLRHAVQKAPHNIAYKIRLGKFLLNVSRYLDSAEIFRSLIKEGWDNPDRSSNRAAASIVNFYFVSLTFAGHYEQVLTEVDNWFGSEYNGDLRGIAKSAALKRRSEGLKGDDKVWNLREAARLLAPILGQDTPPFSAASVARSVITEVVFASRNPEIVSHPDFPELLEFSSRFTEQCFFSTHSMKNFADDGRTVVRELSRLPIETNPFRSEKWPEGEFDTGVPLLELIFDRIKTGELKVATVTNVLTQSKAPCAPIFARDAQGSDYYCTFSRFLNGGEAQWRILARGQRIAVAPDPAGPPGKGKSNAAREVYWLGNGALPEDLSL